MRILLINTSERIGGAAVAAGRLMEALKNNGIKAKLLVRDKQTDHIDVVPLGHSRKLLWKFVWERIVIWHANHFKKHNLFAVDLANTGTDITALPEFKQADIIHLHWINQGMLSLKNIEQILASGKPVVWTLHDMWPFTGICHHAGGCIHYRTECHHCPLLLGGGSAKDLSTRTFRRKMKTYHGHRIHFVAVSRWMEEVAAQSALIKGHTLTTITNPLNVNLFKPIDKLQARTACSLPADKRLLLFGSLKITDKRKGIDYLVEACRLLDERYPALKEELEVIVFGNRSALLEGLIPFRVHPFDYIADKQLMVSLYNAADIYVTPSLEESMGYTVVEAMACGVPCVGFKVGGIPEIIDHLHNGYVADYRSADDFAQGIHWLLTDPEYAVLAEQARRKIVANHAENVVMKRYVELYNKISGRHA